MADSPATTLGQMPAAMMAVCTAAAMVGTGIWTTIKYRDKLAKEVEAPLKKRLDDLEERIEKACTHIVKAIALASRHNDAALDLELQCAATALSKRG